MPKPHRDGPYLFMVDKIGAVDPTVFAFGPVNPVSTEDRDPTGDPLNGFPCAGTPLGRGHLIALFLDGANIRHSYAPQYEQWQQGGACKQMEMKIEREDKQGKKSGSQLSMAVSVSYEHTGNHSAAEQAAFQWGNLKPWTDFRIPSRFEVGTFLGNAQGATEIIGALNDNATAAAAILALLSKPFVSLQGDLGHSTMPDADHRYWHRNLIRAWATKLYEGAKVAFETQKAAWELKHHTDAAQKKPSKPARTQQGDHGAGDGLCRSGDWLHGRHQTPDRCHVEAR